MKTGAVSGVMSNTGATTGANHFRGFTENGGISYQNRALSMRHHSGGIKSG
jgi:hypothetical protein